MHLLAVQPGGFVDDAGTIASLGQTAAEVVILSAADTTLALLAQAYEQLHAALFATPSEATSPVTSVTVAGQSAIDCTATFAPLLSSQRPVSGNSNSNVQAPLLPGLPSLRLANLMHLRQPASLDLYVQEVLQHARLVIVDHLGGESYWPYGTQRLVELAASHGTMLAMFSGDTAEDLNLLRQSTVPATHCRTLWRYLREGGLANARAMLHYIGHTMLGRHSTLPEPMPPCPMPPVAVYHPRHDVASVQVWSGDGLVSAPGLTPSRPPGLTPGCAHAYEDCSPQPAEAVAEVVTEVVAAAQNRAGAAAQAGTKGGAMNAECPPTASEADDPWRWRRGAPVVLIVFYRAHLQAGNTAVFDALCRALLEQGLNPLPLALSSLKDPASLAVLRSLCAQHAVSIILNTTAFAHTTLDDGGTHALAGDVPVLQVILSGSNEQSWQANPHGLRAADMAMHIALPEVDGRIITRAVSFKGLARRSSLTQSDIVCYQPHPERIAWVAALAHRWCHLRHTPAPARRLALVLASYPSGSEGRIGSGVGLDTPASTVAILHALHSAGYTLGSIPPDGDALMHALLSGITNDPAAWATRAAWQSLGMQDYLAFFGQLPEANRQAVLSSWGPPEADPMLRTDPGSGQPRFLVAGLRCGHTFIGIQPTRGHHILGSADADSRSTYHDPDLPPPHHYIAFYAWLRQHWRADAVVHIGKHGNLEWLPGKSVALSQQCWPDALLGPVPHLYPFIVNDPGEGAQAKRRAQAVIIDHLMPPLTRAESHGPARDLERMVDEYYEAIALDPPRARLLRRDILQHILGHHLHSDLGLPAPRTAAEEQALLNKTDAYLCELKESQIRDGLHTFGHSPAGRLQRDTLLALARHPVGDGQGANDSLIRALAHDLGLCVPLPPPALPAAHDDELVDAESLPPLVFDPLDCDWTLPWPGPRPAALHGLTSEHWRTTGDTRERLELLALQLLDDLTASTSSHAHTTHTHTYTHTPGCAPSGELDDGCNVGSGSAPGGTPPAQGQPEVPHASQQPRHSTGTCAPAHSQGLAGTPCCDPHTPTPLVAWQTLQPAHPDEAVAAWPRTHAVLRRVRDDLLPRLQASGPQEIAHLLLGLAGRFVPAGPSGSPTRGRPDVLPTGRNFYSLDTRSLPTPTSWTLGSKAARLLVQRYTQEHGEYPRSLGLSIWGTATMRTGGDDIAQAFALIGARPRWTHGSWRVSGFDILPLSALGRPRVDVMLRISGFFRDAFTPLIHLFDAAVQQIAGLEEENAHDNPIRARILQETHWLRTQGLDAAAARHRAGLRVFGSQPGGYGAGLQPLMDSGHWSSDADLAHAWLQAAGYAYGQHDHGSPAAQALQRQLAAVQLVLHNQDSREHDILDSGDYAQFHGGMAAAVRHYSGQQPALYFGDHANPQVPRVRPVQEEISRVIRARVTNPKWLAGIRRHGYKGAFEAAATVDYLFAYDAAARVVRDDQYARVSDALVLDSTMRQFMRQHNPQALHDICARLLEAIHRGLWQHPGDYRQHLEHHLLHTEQLLEA